jgi:hypothetical protein
VKRLSLVPVLLSGLVFGADTPPPREDRKPASVTAPAMAAGAAIGAAMTKDNHVKGAIVGAAVGGVIGLIIDQIAKNRNVASPAPLPPAEIQKSPEF